MRQVHLQPIALAAPHRNYFPYPHSGGAPGPLLLHYGWPKGKSKDVIQHSIFFIAAHRTCVQIAVFFGHITQLGHASSLRSRYNARH